MTGISVGGRGFTSGPPPPPETTLYGAEGGSATTSDLHTIDPATGDPMSIGPIGFALTGLAFRPSDGVLFGMTSNNSAANPRSLITIDPVTGAGTLIGAHGITGGGTITDIAFRDDDVLYGFHGSNYKLYTFNLATGAGTQVNGNVLPGGGSHFGIGCSFDSAGNFYVFPDGSDGDFYEVDEAAVTFTTVADLSGTPDSSLNVAAAAADADDAMYATLLASGVTAHLVTIDLVTGVITDIGESVAKLDAIAWSV